MQASELQLRMHLRPLWTPRLRVSGGHPPRGTFQGTRSPGGPVPLPTAV